MQNRVQYSGNYPRGRGGGKLKVINTVFFFIYGCSCQYNRKIYIKIVKKWIPCSM